MDFFKSYLLNIDLNDIQELEIKDDLFDIKAKIEKENSSFSINIFVKAKDYDISLYERIIKE